jgi:hypothetical protein
MEMYFEGGARRKLASTMQMLASAEQELHYISSPLLSARSQR